MGSQQFVCIRLVQDRRNVAILATVTVVLILPARTMAVIVTGIVFFIPNESN